MYVCVYVYMYVSMYVCMYVRTSIRIYVSTSLSLSIYIYIYIYSRLGVCPPGNRVRFWVRVVRVGEAKLRGREKGDSPPVARGQRDQKASVVIRFGARVVPDKKSSGKFIKVIFKVVI